MTTQTSKMGTSAPCRLSVYLARDASIAAILRRGPSKWVQLIRWNTRDDTFVYGQWFKGVIYPHYSDLSPDGTKFIYCARKENGRPVKTAKVGNCWTAISKPPFLTALALWSCYGAWTYGGLFISNSHLMLNQGSFPDSKPRLKTTKGHLPTDIQVEAGGFLSDQQMSSHRLHLNGWELIQDWQGEFIEGDLQKAYREIESSSASPDITGNSNLLGLKANARYVTHAPGIYEKQSLRSKGVLQLTATRKRFVWVFAYGLRTSANEVELQRASWADWDQQGRLVFAHGGKLFARHVHVGGVDEPVELADFNECIPTPMEAPDWAKVW